MLTVRQRKDLSWALPVPADTRTGYIRQAPKFAPGCEPDRVHIYTAITLGEFLGWNRESGKATDRLLNGLNALVSFRLPGGGKLNNRISNPVDTRHAQAHRTQAEIRCALLDRRAAGHGAGSRLYGGGKVV